MATYREQGIVLRSYKLGETDRIVHLLTQGRGKVRAVVKGVRRPGSRFGAGWRRTATWTCSCTRAAASTS
jgi:DNA repair protein RecO (recombination protein O)